MNDKPVGRIFLDEPVINKKTDPCQLADGGMADDHIIQHGGQFLFSPIPMNQSSGKIEAMLFLIISRQNLVHPFSISLKVMEFKKPKSPRWSPAMRTG